MKHPQTVTVYPEKNENKAAYLLWRSLRAALLTAGALIALMVIWNVDLKGLFVLPLGGAVTVLLGCIAGDYLGAKKNIYRAAAAVPWLVFLPVCFVTGNPLSGGMSWVNRLITRWNAAHEGGAALLPTTDLAGDIIAFTLLLTMLCALVSWLCTRGGRRGPVAVYCLIWVLIGLVGEAFSPLATALLLCGLLGEYTSCKAAYRTLHAGVMWAVTAVFLIGFALVLPAGNISAVDTLRENTEEGVHTLRYGEATLPEGDISKADILHETGEEMLTVQSGQKKSFYLRGFVGGDYEDGAWRAMPDAAYGGEQSGILKWLQDHNFDPLMQVSQYYSLSTSDSKPSENRVSVTVSGAERSYVYTPSSVSGTDWSGAFEEKDTRFNSFMLTGVHEYTFDERSGSRPSELTVAEAWVTDPVTDAQAAYCEAEEVYRDFVYDTYTAVEADLLPLLQSMFWDNYESRTDGVYSAVRRVRDVLEWQAAYTDSPEAAPVGTDPIRWFLTKSHSGNAVQYASAAVQALRAHGIPARYVEGYYAPAERIASGDTTLTGQDAHAWAEVYFDGVGWLPIDTTPGYYYDAVTLRDMVDTPDNVHKTAALEDSRIDVSPVTKPGNNSGPFTDPVGTAINAANLLLGIAAALVLLLTVLFLLFEIARGVIYMTEIKKFRSAKNQERILFLGRKILCYLRLWNIEASIGWNTAEVDAAIVNAFPNIEPGSYTRVCELLEKAVYGGIALEVYEERTVQSFLEHLVTTNKHVESVQRGIYLHLYTEYHARGLAEAFGVAGYHRFLHRAGKHKVPLCLRKRSCDAQPECLQGDARALV